jgi:hypothetical protein
VARVVEVTIPSNATVSCRIDTGFSGDILVGGQEFGVLFNAGLLSRGGYGRMRLADGTMSTVWLYDAHVDWVNGTEDIDVAVPVTAAGQPVANAQSLLGVGLLDGYCLLIEFAKRNVQIYP